TVGRIFGTPRTVLRFGRVTDGQPTHALVTRRGFRCHESRMGISRELMTPCSCLLQVRGFETCASPAATACALLGPDLGFCSAWQLCSACPSAATHPCLAFSTGCGYEHLQQFPILEALFDCTSIMSRERDLELATRHLT